MYLGGHIRQATLDNGVKAWDFGSSQYVQAAVKNVEEYLKKQGKKLLPTKGHINTCTSTYCTDIHISQELETQDASYYQSTIDIIRQIVELGRVGICVEVSMMSSCVAFSRKGHIYQVLHIFGYLKKHYNGEMLLDPNDPDINMSQFEKQYLYQTIYVQLTEAIPPNAPLSCGRGMCMTVWVDSYHAKELL